MRPRSLSSFLIPTACIVLDAAPLAATPERSPLRSPLPGTPARSAQAESTFTCFESDRLVPAINPGCFVTFSPPQPGDCSSHGGHYLLQALRLDLSVPHRVLGFRFRSNDGNTVYPKAGALLAPVLDGLVLPGPEELAALPVRPVSSATDTTWVFVDLAGDNLVLPNGGWMALLLVLQFPEFGQLTAVGDGPGIEVDADAPDQDCDFFTLDGGSTWMAPAYDPTDPLSPPLDWGFVVHLQPVLPVTPLSWGHIKSLYRTP